MIIIRVAQIQLAIAKLYDNIVAQPQTELEFINLTLIQILYTFWLHIYYFVVYYGRDFGMLNGCKFVYCDPQQSELRGEKLPSSPQKPRTPQKLGIEQKATSFISRLLDCHPAARPANPVCSVNFAFFLLMVLIQNVERLVFSQEGMPTSLTLLPGKYLFIVQVFPFVKTVEVWQHSYVKAVHVHALLIGFIGGNWSKLEDRCVH